MVILLNNEDILSFINHLLSFQKNDTCEMNIVINKFKELGFKENEVKKNLTILKSLNKKYINSLLKEFNQSTTETKNVDEKEYVEYSREDIYIYFREDDEVIKEKFKINDLKSMYNTFYNQKPRSSMKKQDLINSIRGIIRSESRSNAFNR